MQHSTYKLHLENDTVVRSGRPGPRRYLGRLLHREVAVVAVAIWALMYCVLVVVTVSATTRSPALAT